MVETYKVAGEVDSWCTKCKRVAGHIIVALKNNLPKKVRCKSCDGEHNYRGNKPEDKISVTKKTISKKSEAARLNDYQTRLKDRNLSEAKQYIISGNFEKDALIDHTKFGIGIILSIIQDKRIDVLFKDGQKILVQNYSN